MDMFESTKAKKPSKFRRTTIEQYLQTVNLMKLRPHSFTSAAKKLGFSSASMSKVRIALRNGTFDSLCQLSEADILKVKEAEKWLLNHCEPAAEEPADDDVILAYGPPDKVLEAFKKIMEQKRQPRSAL